MKKTNALKKRTGEIAAAVNSKLPWLRFFVFFFAFICLYNYLVVNRAMPWKVSEMSFSYHLLTYDFGFLTRLLPGTVYHLFFKEVVPEQVTAFETVLLLIAYAAISFMLARMIAGIKETQYRKPVFILCLFFISGPVSFGVFSEELGMFDSWWMFLAVIFMAVVDSKYLKWLSPALFFAMILVHNASLFTYVVLCGLVLLYRASAAENKGEKAACSVVFFLSCAAAIGLFFYFLVYEQSNTALSMEEFDAEMTARAGKHSEYLRLEHYNFYFYFDRVIEYYAETGEYHGLTVFPHIEANLPAPLLALINALIGMVFVTFTQYGAFAKNLFQTPLLIALALPLIILCYSFWINMIKHSENKLKKLCFALAMVQYPLAVILGTLLSTDGPRFLAHAFIAQLAFLLYTAYKEKNLSLEIIKSITDGLDRRLVICYFLTWAAIRVTTYT